MGRRPGERRYRHILPQVISLSLAVLLWQSLVYFGIYEYLGTYQRFPGWVAAADYLPTARFINDVWCSTVEF